MARRMLFPVAATYLLCLSMLLHPAALAAQNSCWSVKEEGALEIERTVVAGKSIFVELVKSDSLEPFESQHQRNMDFVIPLLKALFPLEPAFCRHDNRNCHFLFPPA